MGQREAKSLSRGHLAVWGVKSAAGQGGLDPAAVLLPTAPHCPPRKTRHASSTLSAPCLVKDGLMEAIPEFSLIGLNQREMREQPVNRLAFYLEH